MKKGDEIIDTVNTGLCMVDEDFSELMDAFQKSNKVKDLCAWLVRACPDSQVEFIKVLTLDGSAINIDGRGSKAYINAKKLISLNERNEPRN